MLQTIAGWYLGIGLALSVLAYETILGGAFDMWMMRNLSENDAGFIRSIRYIHRHDWRVSAFLRFAFMVLVCMTAWPGIVAAFIRIAIRKRR
jgi:hypothetical protein